jgi:phage terminase large subunit GpA-like protein
MTQTTEVLRTVRQRWAPPPNLTVSDFCDREIIVTTGPLAGTHWQTDFSPYQRGILNAFHEPGVEIVVVMGSSQWGKTSCAVNLVAYHIAHDPCPILIVEPTVDPMARDFAKNRLDTVIQASPLLRDTVSKKRSRDASNTTLAKTFRGGSLSVGGANSAASLAARSVRLLVLDEVDRYPPELPGEGSTLAIAFKRTIAYRRRRRILMTSSPTLRGAPIDVWFQRGDQRHFYVPCPNCGVFHTFQWAQVRWLNSDPTTAHLECPSCAHRIDDAERVAILADGEWRAEKSDRDDRTIVSFHLWEAYSPLSSLTEIVASFLRARAAQKSGDRSEMHAWQNTTLGEPVDPDDGDGVEPTGLLLRREPYPRDVDVPSSACCVTMGVDVQDDRIELLAIGWGPGEESWLIDRQTLPGDTSRPEPWAALDQVLDQPLRHEGGARLMVQSTCVDSAGHRTDLVYDWVSKRAARRVYAIIGRDGQRPIVSSPSPRGWGQQARKVPLYTVGVDAAKAMWISRLSLTEHGPGFVHFPHASWCDEELVAQLTSERLVTRWNKGVPVQVWKKMRPRNEMLDCAVYALAALRLLNARLPIMAEMLQARGADPHSPHASGAPTPARRVRRVSFSPFLG